MARKQVAQSTTTIEENEKKLRNMALALESLKRSGAVRTTDPRHMNRRDVESYIIHLKKQDLKPVTRGKYLQTLKGYLEFWGNRIIDDIISTDGRIFPTKSGDPIRALSVDDLKRIFESADRMSGYQGIIMRGVLALTFATGIRPKEFIKAELTDLDLKGCRFYVRHPKGEESWGSPQWIPIIRGDMIPRLQRYIEERTELAKMHGDSKYLFFNYRSGDPYTLKAIRVMKAKIEDDSGVSFYLKDMRSTLATLTIMGNLERLKPVSLQLRHSKLSTTEEYYARIQEGEIENAIGEAWKDTALE